MSRNVSTAEWTVINSVLNKIAETHSAKLSQLRKAHETAELALHRAERDGTTTEQIAELRKTIRDTVEAIDQERDKENVETTEAVYLLGIRLGFRAAARCVAELASAEVLSKEELARHTIDSMYLVRALVNDNELDHLFVALTQ